MLSRRQWLVFLMLAGGFALLAPFYLSTITFYSRHPERSDFSKFYLSAQYYWKGESIYKEVPINSIIELAQQLNPGQNLELGQPSPSLRINSHPNLNPPFQTLILAPLGLLAYPAAFWIFSSLSLLAGLLGAGLIAQETETRCDTVPLWLGAWVVLLAYFGTWAAIVYGQFALFLLLACAVGWAGMRRGHERLAGAALGLGLSLKIFLGLFLIFFLVRRKWRALFWFIGVFAGLSLLSLLICGVQAFKEYQTVLRGITWYAASWNASFMRFFTRILGGSENLPLLDAPKWASALTHLASLLFVAGFVWLAWPQSRASSRDLDDLAFALTIIGMLLISPLGWMYYFPVLLIPLAVAWRASGDLAPGKRYKILIIAAWVLSSIPHLLIPSAEVNGLAMIFFWGGMYFYSLLLLAAILFGLVLRLRRRRPAREIS